MDLSVPPHPTCQSFTSQNSLTNTELWVASCSQQIHINQAVTERSLRQYVCEIKAAATCNQKGIKNVLNWKTVLYEMWKSSCVSVGSCFSFMLPKVQSFLFFSFLTLYRSIHEVLGGVRTIRTAFILLTFIRRNCYHHWGKLLSHSVSHTLHQWESSFRSCLLD